MPQTLKNNFLFLILLSGFLSSCTENKRKTIPEEEISTPVTDTVLGEVEEEPEPRLLITYHLDSIRTAAEVDSFETHFSEDFKKHIFALNRVDAYRLNAGDQLIIPDTLTGNFMDYSPFPVEMKIFDSIPKTVLVNRRIQGFGLYEKGKLIRWGPVSSGKESTPTPAGLHYGNFKAKDKVSTVNDDWLLPYYFNFMNFEGVGVHQYSMPGYPASHACVRLRMDDAVFIYDWAKQWELNENRQKVVKNGTPFMVIGDYAFDKPKPWLLLAKDPEFNFLTSAEMDTLKNYVTRYLQDPRNFDKPETIEEELLAASGEDTIKTLQ